MKQPRSELWISVFVFMCMLFVARRALGQVERAAPRQTYALNWVRGTDASDCISSNALASGVEQVLGPVFRPPSEATRAIEGSISRDAATGKFKVSIHLADTTGAFVGERSFERDAADCTALTASVLLVVLLVIDPSMSERDLPAELLAALASDDDDAASTLLAELQGEQAAQQPVHPQSTPPMAADAARLPNTPAAVPAPTPVASGAGFDLQLGALLEGSYGVQPKLSPGAGLIAKLHTPWLVSIELAASYWLNSAVALSEPTELGNEVLFSAAQSALSACLRLWQASRFRIDACLGAAFGVRWTHAAALVQHADPARSYLVPQASAELDYDLGPPWFLAGHVRLLTMLVRDRFYYTDIAGQSLRLFRPPPLGAAVDLGVGVRL